ncbi:hypothetical protein OG21DRAFT_137089 [Imleria badia]|nr:hypothetical protein OG21DRAFT_137089 [Imleria badia]
MGIPHPGWGIGQQEVVFSSENLPTFNYADPAVEIDGSLYPQIAKTEVSSLYSRFTYTLWNQVLQAVQKSLQTAPLPFVEQSIEPTYSCQWVREYGTLCEDKLTPVNLPMHLSKHGIHNLTRNHPTRCNWVGCKTKKTMNRESIVRHIREVHMRLKRSSKQVQERYL